MICEIYILDAPYQLDRAFDYVSFLPEIREGSIVRVPFGRANSLRLGVVFRMKDGEDGKSLKPVHSVLGEEISLSKNMLGLCSFLKEHTLCTFGEAVKSVLPPMALTERLNISYRKTVSLAKDADYIRLVLSTKGKIGVRSEGQRIVLNFLLGCTEADYELVRAQPAVNTSHIAALKAKGLIRITESEKIRNPYAEYAAERDTAEIALSRAQGEAYSTLRSLFCARRAACALLHGITGSGKTKIIMKMIDDCLSEGKSAMMLVPEISLTPQTVSIFCKRYGDRIAVIHSSLSQGERTDAWRRIQRGEATLVIGTRSAILTPLENIGLIVIDEEHEHTYKSDSDPKYHARDIASYLCGRDSALLVLSSATPSVESYYKAKSGIYTLVSLKERYGGVRLPDAVIVDMREELRLGNTTPISDRLLKTLEEVRARGEQAILFLNRRGYNSQISCRDCGEVISCPRCSVSLTYHKTGGGKLLCHLCGYTMPTPRRCPSCEGEHLSFLGYGTQKVEAELANYLSGVRIMRMDADTTQGKLAYDKLLSDFRQDGADILLGTQMVAKGHDFPKVTLVGVVLADTSLYVADFRANERTFSLLTQVIGRAGRASDTGVAVIQTMSPKNEIIRLACRQDYESFYEGEIAQRRELIYPPFCDIAQITVTSDSEKGACEGSVRAGEILVEELKGAGDKAPVIMFGPFEAGVYKVNEKFRMRIILKCKLTREVRAVFSRALIKCAAEIKNSTVSVDLNPQTV